MSTTTATEISSNLNSSCRLLVCLNTLPFQDQCIFCSLLVPIGLLRLSACCRLLRSSIRDDRALWQALYHRNFLSGDYYTKEMDFVLWCVRTDVNNPCTSDKRADLLENVDWYNTYRRRLSTENNWRFGRCKTTHIDMEEEGCISNYSTEFPNNSSVIVQTRRSNETSDHSYSLEYLPHSNLRLVNNIVYSSTPSTSPNLFLLDSDINAQYFYVLGDHYIALFPIDIKSDTNYNVKILSRKHGSIFTTFDVPVQYEVMTVEGKWILLVHERVGLFNDLPIRILDIMVFDIDNSIMCSGSIDDTWNATRLYKTTNNTAIVYTARLVEDDDVGRIEWALYQFSSNNHVVQLRNGWFQLPERVTATSIYLARNPNNSHMIIRLHGNHDNNPCIIHSVASNGQSHIPRNCYTISKQHIPTSLLWAGCDYSILGSDPTKVRTDLFYNDDQVLQMPGTIFIRHIIGDLYMFIVKARKRLYSRLLVDINTKEIVRQMEEPKTDWSLDRYAMSGILCNSYNSEVQTIHEYGEL